MADFHTICGTGNLPDADAQFDLKVRMAEAAPVAALCWFAEVGIVRPSGEQIRRLAALMVAGFKLPEPSWAQQAREPVEAEFERLRDKATFIERDGIQSLQMRWRSAD